MYSETAELAEFQDSNGIHAGSPKQYHINDDELSFMLEDMKARVRAIECEMERRKFRAEKIVYTFLAEKCKPINRDSYTQPEFY